MILIFLKLIFKFTQSKYFIIAFVDCIPHFQTKRNKNQFRYKKLFLQILIGNTCKIYFFLLILKFKLIL